MKLFLKQRLLTTKLGHDFLHNRLLRLDSDSEPQNSAPGSTCNNDIVPQFMEYRPNSRSYNSTTMLPLQSITQDLVLEHYVLTRAIDQRVSPKDEK